MKVRAQGTYPRRAIKQTHNRNPTFHSFHLFDVLHPTDNPEKLESSNISQTNKYRPAFYFNNIIPTEIPKKKSVSYIPTNKFEFAEILSNEVNNPSKQIERKAGNERSKSSGKLQLDSLSFAELQFNNNKMHVMDHVKQLNFKSSRSIIQKQNVNYNIINNLQN